MKSVSFWTELSSTVHLFSKTVPELIQIIIISCIVISVDIINNWFTLCSSKAASKLTQTNTMCQAYCWCPRNISWIESYWGNAWWFPRFLHKSLFGLYHSFISFLVYFLLLLFLPPLLFFSNASWDTESGRNWMKSFWFQSSVVLFQRLENLKFYFEMWSYFQTSCGLI